MKWPATAGRHLRLFVLCATVTGALQAHDTWLKPGSGSVPQGAVVLLDLTSGMSFPALDHAIEIDRIDRAHVRLGGRTSDLIDRRKGEQSLRFEARLDTVGVAIVWASLKPRSIELKPHEATEYLDEVGAPEAVRKAWAGAGSDRPWRESYTKHVLTFVRVGEPQPDRSWAVPAGLPLEFVPEEDPTNVMAGEAFPVRVLANGRPLAGFPVGAVHAGGGEAMKLNSDQDGRIVLRPGLAGWWLLRATEIRRSSIPGADWQSEFATMTFEVHPRTP